ncbi:bacteriocin immunity protein [Agrilactobacillus yilanensis]|uniref:Bacteriocin immunity protein n=1 Tax=Agrilactobacillus yilanensis TaxID=2485997 RepID=A0ABW4J8L7_9LACO|nr:bacteriocin immunity protein [Agrilactobacillus yilanensis]
MGAKNEANVKIMMDELSKAYSDPEIKARPDLQEMLLTYAKELEKTEDCKLVATQLTKEICLSWFAKKENFPKALITLHSQIKSDAVKYDGVMLSAAMLPVWF